MQDIGEEITGENYLVYFCFPCYTNCVNTNFTKKIEGEIRTSGSRLLIKEYCLIYGTK